jgi:hypothetical protein
MTADAGARRGRPASSPHDHIRPGAPGPHPRTRGTASAHSATGDCDEISRSHEVRPRSQFGISSRVKCAQTHLGPLGALALNPFEHPLRDGQAAELARNKSGPRLPRRPRSDRRERRPAGVEVSLFRSRRELDRQAGARDGRRASLRLQRATSATTESALAAMASTAGNTNLRCERKLRAAPLGPTAAANRRSATPPRGGSEEHQTLHQPGGASAAALTKRHAGRPRAQTAWAPRRTASAVTLALPRDAGHRPCTLMQPRLSASHCSAGDSQEGCHPYNAASDSRGDTDAKTVRGPTRRTAISRPRRGKNPRRWHDAARFGRP